MHFKYSNGLLLSDLICLFKKTSEIKYLEEVKNRMEFCGFSPREIKMFVSFESDIASNKKMKYERKILDNYWIIGKKDEKNIFKFPEHYMYDPESDNSETLLLSETLTIIDEAFIVSHPSQINFYKAKDEIISLSQENSKNWPFYEFKNRLEYICRYANQINNSSKMAMYNEKINNLYENEMQICIGRWNDLNIFSRCFEPYTEDFYN